MYQMRQLDQNHQLRSIRLTCTLLLLVPGEDGCNSGISLESYSCHTVVAPRRCLVVTGWLSGSWPTSHLPTTLLATWKWTDGLNEKRVFRHL